MNSFIDPNTKTHFQCLVRPAAHSIYEYILRIEFAVSTDRFTPKIIIIEKEDDGNAIKPNLRNHPEKKRFLRQSCFFPLRLYGNDLRIMLCALT